MFAAMIVAAEEKVVITIEGMSGKESAVKVDDVLKQIEGVRSTEIGLEPGCATVVFDDQKTNPEIMIKQITALGYKAKIDSNAIPVQAVAETKAMPAGGCPMAASCREAGTKAKCGLAAPQATSPKAEAAGQECVTLTQCKEFNDFYGVMHPMHEALTNGNYAAVCQGYPELTQKAEALKAMTCDQNCVKDLGAFENNRTALLSCVAELGDACKGNDNAKLTQIMEKMHETYNEMGRLAK